MRQFAQSERLLLRALELGDAHALASIRGCPDVARFQSWSSFTLDDARSLIARSESREPDTPGQWYPFGLALADGGDLIGDCALHCPVSDPRQAEIGFTLGREHWGRGYATEAVSALVSWLFQVCGKERIFAIVDGRNSAAQGVLRKAGFERVERLDRMVWFKGEFGPECTWALRPQS